MNRPAAALVLLALAAPAGTAQDLAAKARLTDPEAEALARQALGSEDAQFQRRALTRLEAHHFKSSLARERELVLFAQGRLLERLGDGARAAATYHKLESSWPQSPLLAECQATLAEAALNHGRSKEAESRLNKALNAELPAEEIRRCQELLLWCLADQGHASDGIATVKALKPLGTARPTEKGLVGILEALCAAKSRTEAEGIRADYHKLYPQGAYRARVDLDWGKLLGAANDNLGAARAFQKLIKDYPQSGEADEARMALATLLTDGSLPPKDAQGFPDAQALLSRVKKAGAKEEATRRTLMINLRIALRERHWQAALDTVAQYRASHPSPGEARPAEALRAEAARGLAQEALEQQSPGRILGYLDAETVQALTPTQRQGLARLFAQKGLAEAAQALQRAVPAKERPALAKAAVSGLQPGAAPQATLALVPAKASGPQEALLRAQAAVAARAWGDARAALGRARPGPDRIQALVAYLCRPPEKDEKPEARAREVDAWLARAPEKGEQREPLQLLAADHKVRDGAWKAALALYPAHPSAPHRGWVALMRATCLARLGQKPEALAILKDAKDEAAFRSERTALERRLGL